VHGPEGLAVSDGIRETTEGQAGELARSEPAALVTLAHYPGQSVGALARTLGLTHCGAVRLAAALFGMRGVVVTAGPAGPCR
jgi:hypothetical protein